MSSTEATPQEYDATEPVEGDQLQLVTFEVADEEYAVDILAVQEINRMMEITRVPQAPEEVKGVINLRGKIIPVVDIRRRFKIDERESTTDDRIIVVKVQGRVLGFIVDRVHEVLRISASIIEPPPAMISSVDSDFISGVSKLDDRLITLLDLERLFAADFMDQAESAVERAAAA
ncbi:MAG: chemotaxis protein CheW [Phycisphaerales bacterium]|nr:chemotaxis protein CheW [Phycisphaerales bacterium]